MIEASSALVSVQVGLERVLLTGQHDGQVCGQAMQDGGQAGLGRTVAHGLALRRTRPPAASARRRFGALPDRACTAQPSAHVTQAARAARQQLLVALITNFAQA